jgi:CheY-like chemotaxis protein
MPMCGPTRSDAEGSRYRVIEAFDGPSAIIALEANRVDLIFTDVVLPRGMTGAQIVAKAKTMQPKIKALFTTGYARNAIVHHGRLDPGVNLITKPSVTFWT